MKRIIKTIPKVQLYWLCELCVKPNPWPQEKARKYCDKSCQDKAYYRRKNGREKREEMIIEAPKQDTYRWEYLEAARRVKTQSQETSNEEPYIKPEVAERVSKAVDVKIIQVPLLVNVTDKNNE